MNHLQIENALIGNGWIIRENKRKGKSLSRADRGVILKVRNMAMKEGFTKHSINMFELEGERGTKGMVMPEVTARFIGVQEMMGWKLRLYNIEGDHPLNNSTVAVSTLFFQGISVPDLNFVQIVYQLLNETLFSISCKFYDIYYRIKGR